MTQMQRVRGVVGVLAGVVAVAIGSMGLPGRRADGAADDKKADVALERTRAQAKMLDDLFKVAVVDINNRYDGPPAAKVAKAIFAAARDKKYFNARLLDVTGDPQNEANVPADEFEKKAAAAIKSGQAYYEQVVDLGSSRRLRVATVVPAVTEKCAKCHGVEKGDLLGFISYDMPVE